MNYVAVYKALKSVPFKGSGGGARGDGLALQLQLGQADGETCMQAQAMGIQLARVSL